MTHVDVSVDDEFANGPRVNRHPDAVPSIALGMHDVGVEDGHVLLRACPLSEVKAVFFELEIERLPRAQSHGIGGNGRLCTTECYCRLPVCNMVIAQRLGGEGVEEFGITGHADGLMPWPRLGAHVVERLAKRGHHNQAPGESMALAVCEFGGACVEIHGKFEELVRLASKPY